MEALIVIDVQNEFTERGKRPVVDIEDALEAISRRVAQARKRDNPIVWIRHFNKPNESPAFVPGTWGSEFIPVFGQKPGVATEIEMRSFLTSLYMTLFKFTKKITNPAFEFQP